MQLLHLSMPSKNTRRGGLPEFRLCCMLWQSWKHSGPLPLLLIAMSAAVLFLLGPPLVPRRLGVVIVLVVVLDDQ